MRLLSTLRYILNVTFQYPENYNIQQQCDSNSAGHHNFYLISPSSLLLDSLSLCSSINVTDPHEIICNITVLYILNIIFLDTKPKTKDSGAEGSKHFLNSCALNFLCMLPCKSFVTYFSRNTTTVELLVLFYTCKSAAQPTVHLKCKHCIRLHVFHTRPCNVYPTYCSLKWTYSQLTFCLLKLI